MNKNIGIMGGSFNPIHMAHLIMADYVYETGMFDEILFMPTGNPPHKKLEDLESSFHRINMIKLAIKGCPYFELSDYESNREDSVYTVDTIRSLREENPDIDYHMIIGADSLMNLLKWKSPEELLRICNFVVVNRHGFSGEEINNQVTYLEGEYAGKFTIVEIPNLEISSRDIRNRMLNCKSIRYIVPDRVKNYIYAHGLYGGDQVIYNEIVDEIKKKLKKKLEESRYEHTLSMVDTAIDLAVKYGCNPRKACIAALLHDCAKNYSDDKKYDLCDKYNVSLSKAEKENIDLVHAKLGAKLAKHKYHIYDEEILSAISLHTTGNPEMTLLEKIIYVADYIEPLRTKADNLDEVRELVKTSLDETLYAILEHTMDYLEDKDKYIDPITKETYKYYKKKRKEE